MAVKNPQVISPLPLPPNPADRSTFNTRAYPWSNALAPWTTQTNQAAADTYANAVDSAASATSANSSKNAAAGSASAASTDAGLANGYKNEAFVSKQSASTSAGLADASRVDAQLAALAAVNWATSTTVIADGNKGAKGYALDAAQSAADAAAIVSGDIFDDSGVKTNRGWTSSKIVAWFNGLTTTFTRTLLSRTNAAQARADLELGTAATKDVATNAQALTGTANVLTDAAGVHAAFKQFGYGGQNPNNNTLNCDDLPAGSRNAWTDTITETTAVSLNLPALGGSSSASRSWHVECFGRGSSRLVQEATEVYGAGTTRGRTFIRVKHDATWYPWQEVYTTGNILTTTGQSTDYPMTQKAVTDALAAAGGVGEIDYITLANNAASLTPAPGKSYRMTRTTGSVLTTTLTCTYKSDKIRSWHMIVSKGSGAGDNFIPKFSLTGLTQTLVAWSGGGTEPPIVSGVYHVMIAFTQIDQSVRAQVVDGW